MNGTDIKDIRDSRIAFAQAGSETNDIIAGDKYVVQNYITEQKNIRQSTSQTAAMPYKFLASYEIADHDIFFGRDAAIEELLGLAPRYQTLVINGRSGAGKTSLLHAGLIPRLTDMGYQYLSFRDYSDPLGQLRDYAAQHDRLKPVAESFSLPGLLKAMSSGFDGAHKPQPVAVIFDQFERFFVNVPQALRTAFIQEVKACLHSSLSSADAHLLFAMREDFFGMFVSEFEAQMESFLNDAARLNLRPLRPEEARDAILLPIKNLPTRIGYDLSFVDDVLLPALLNEGGDGGGTVACGRIDPPHVQIVCNQLYQAARDRYAPQLAQGGMAQIDRQLYKELGETRGILRSYLDDVLDRAAQHESGQRDVLRSMLKVMVESTGTRKFVALSDLHRGLPDVAAGQLEQHLRRLQGSRVLETRVSGGDTHYSLSHEVLVDKVQSWFDERELQRKKAQETLTRGLAEWQSTRALLNEKQVANIRQWLSGDELDKEAEGLLDASQQAHEERRRKEAKQNRLIRLGIGIIVGLVALALIVAIVLTNWALREQETARMQTLKAQEQERKAEEQAAEAEYQTSIAISRSLVASALQDNFRENREHAALLARQAYLLLPKERDTSRVQKEIDEALHTIFRRESITAGPYEDMPLPEQVCEKVKLTVALEQEEWTQLVGSEIFHQQACPKLSETEPLHLRSDPMTATDWQALSLNIGRDREPVEDVVNRFEDRGDVVFDRTTHLMWQKGGSENSKTYDEAQRYVEQLNQEQFAGHNDWRLPTIEELLSLLEQTKKSVIFSLSERDLIELKEGDNSVPEELLKALEPLVEQRREFRVEADFLSALQQHTEHIGEDAVSPYQDRLLKRAGNSYSLYLDPVFDSKQWWVWSADIYQIKGDGSPGSAWRVYFSGGDVRFDGIQLGSYVRCVRS